MGSKSMMAEDYSQIELRVLAHIQQRGIEVERIDGELYAKERKPLAEYRTRTGRVESERKR